MLGSFCILAHIVTEVQRLTGVMSKVDCRRIQEERKHRPGWCYHRLRTRWGEDALREFKISVNE